MISEPATTDGGAPAPSASATARPFLRQRLLGLVFFLSGASALIFEHLWFQRTGLAFGNTVWASSIVLAGFMCGLALGNALAARYGASIRRPVATYAAVELLIGAVGLGLVVGFPALDAALAPTLGALAEQPLLAGALRFGLAFALLLLPTAAMGATLPLLVDAQTRADQDFPAALGQLYGLNTLGAMSGVLVTEYALVGWLGVPGSAVFAAALNAVVAALALCCVGDTTRAAPAAEPAAEPAPASGDGRLLLAAALSGCALLALEVIWFRYQLLFVFGSAEVFAVMLAVVLGGIATGGLLAGGGALRGWTPPAFALAAGCASALGYLGYEAVGPSDDGGWLLAGALLMLPTSIASGALFTTLGVAIERHAPAGSAARATGRLTLSNTLGAAAGALLGGFVVLPWLGVDRGLLLLTTLYLPIAALAGRPSLAGSLLLLALLSLCALRPPFVERGVIDPRKGELVEVRETRSGTVAYIHNRHFGEPYFWRLVTNSHSMSSTHIRARNYMRLFVYLPVALHPRPRRALLISYGVATTARALTECDDFESIDFVDISPEILALSRRLPGERHPLDDPRVRVVIEDGRHHLLTTRRTYDLITGEPPPPKAAGIVSLYTREYFELCARRLAPGGMCSYWLPIYQMSEADAAAIAHAFALAFDDCSLWLADRREWVLLGVKAGGERVSEARFRRQWQQPRVAAAMREVGFETPEGLGAWFLADRQQLLDWAGATPPLSDDWPQRLGHRRPGEADAEARMRRWVEPEAAWQRFSTSPHIKRLFPPALREQSRPHFALRPLFDEAFSDFDYRTITPPRLRLLRRVLRDHPELRTAVLWLGNSNPDEQAILARPLKLRGAAAAAAAQRRAVGLLAERRYKQAAAAFRAARALDPAITPAFELLARMHAGEQDAVQRELAAGVEGLSPELAIALGQ